MERMYMENPFVKANPSIYRIITMGVGDYTEMGLYSGHFSSASGHLPVY